MSGHIFSVIIPTYNRTEVLAKTLSCLEKQETNISFEVIIVDDCSTTPVQGLDLRDERRFTLRVLRNEKNQGRAATRNRGIRETACEYILMIDDDIWAAPGLLQAHYEAQKRIGDGVVVGRMPIAKDVNRDIWNEFYSRWTDELHAQMEKRKYNLPYNFFFTGNVSVSKELLERVDLFDESFKGYSGEDTELGYRLKKNGVLFIYEPSAIGFHHNVETLNSILRKRREMGVASCFLCKKHPELAHELSIAGLLAPGKKYYQFLLSPPILNASKILCRLLAAITLKAFCFRSLSVLCQAYSALGLKEAIDAE